MQVFRAVNSKVVGMMRFFNDKDSTKEEDALELIGMLISSPNEVCVSVIFDGNELVGHTCGYKYPENNYVWSFNSWVKLGVNKEYVIAGLDIVKQWSVDNFNIHEIRCETFRNSKAMKRAYNWDEYSTIMELKF